MYEIAYVRFMEFVGKSPGFYLTRYYKCDNCGTEYSVKVGFCPICYKEGVKFRKVLKKIRRN